MFSAVAFPGERRSMCHAPLFARGAADGCASSRLIGYSDRQTARRFLSSLQLGASMQRREFLTALAAAATLGAQNADSRRRFLQSRTAEWDRGIPQWLHETRLPGASLVLIDGG